MNPQELQGLTTIAAGPYQSMVTMNRLIVFAGLPGVGKTHLARQLAATLHAVYLRIDALESPFTPFGDLRDFGYRSASNVARENLLLGHDVIIDAVNPLHCTRAIFRRPRC